MREQAFVCFPESWKKHLPKHLHKYIGRPLLLLMALHGCNHSGKFLCQQQAKFLEEKGFNQTSTEYWVKFFKDGMMIQFLDYVDDILCASDC